MDKPRPELVILLVLACQVGCLLTKQGVKETLVFDDWPGGKELFQICLRSDLIILGMLTDIRGHGVGEMNVHEYSATLLVKKFLDGYVIGNSFKVWLKYYSPQMIPTLPFKERQLLYIFVHHAQSRQQEDLPEGHTANSRELRCSLLTYRSGYARRSLLAIDFAGQQQNGKLFLRRP